MEWFAIIERIVSHIAWPIAAVLIVSQFGGELKNFIRRIKNANYNDVELDLKSEIQEIKYNAANAGVTIDYPNSILPDDSIKNIEAAPEWAVIKYWQEIENVIMELYAETSGAMTRQGPISHTISVLIENGTIDKSMADLVNKLRTMRNKIVHATESEITRGEALEWLGIYKSVRDRLAQKLK